jgi:hypothetical protein
MIRCLPKSRRSAGCWLRQIRRQSNRGMHGRTRQCAHHIC